MQPNLTSVVRNEAQQLDPKVSITRVSTLSGDLLNSIAPLRMATTLTNLFGLTALLLAAIGLYGVMAFTVSQSKREIGVRVALGARNSDVLRMVLRQGMKPALIGMAIGLFAAIVLTRLITGFLYGVSPTDPLTFAAIALLLSAVAALACWLPARHAMRIEPMVALRHE
jgi:ABC-type antimicrobial peptide transport system permease subunit